MRGGDKAAGQRHIQHRHLRLLQQVTSLVESQLQIETRRGARQIFAEQTFELARRDLHRAGQFGAADRLLQILLHAADGGEQLGMANAQPRWQGHALAVALVADALMQELIGNGCSQRKAVLGGDQVQHEVEGGNSARTGEAVAVDLEQFGGHLELREGLHEAGEVFPMHRAAIAIEQAGAGEQVAAQIHRADIHAAAGNAPQLGEDLLVVIGMALHPGTDDELVIAAGFGQRRFGVHGDPVAGGHRPAVLGEHMPAIEFAPAHAVGDALGLDHRGEVHQGKFGNDENRDTLGQAGWRGEQHRAPM